MTTVSWGKISDGAVGSLPRWRSIVGGTGALGVWGGAPGAVRTTVEGPAWSSVGSMLSCVCRDSIFLASGAVFRREGQSLLRGECSSWQLGQQATKDGQLPRIGWRLLPIGQQGLGQPCSAFVCASEQKGQTCSELGQQ